MKSSLRATILCLVTLTTAFACPLCHTNQGKQLRAEILGSDFRFNLSVTAVPFVIFLCIAAFIYFAPPTKEKSA